MFLVIQRIIKLIDLVSFCFWIPTWRKSFIDYWPRLLYIIFHTSEQVMTMSLISFPMFIGDGFSVLVVFSPCEPVLFVELIEILSPLYVNFD